jgi:hypothetical protein
MDAGPQLACTPGSLPAMFTTEVTLYDDVALTGAAVAGAQVEVRAAADDAVLASATTGANGKATLMVPTKGTTLAAYVRASAPGHLPTRLNVARGFDLPTFFMTLFTPTKMNAIASAAGTTWNGTSGVVEITVSSCPPNGMALNGVTVGLDPAGSGIKYRGAPGDAGDAGAGDIAFALAATSTQYAGSAWDFGVASSRAKAVTSTNGSDVVRFEFAVEQGAFNFVAVYR